jgi:oligosaccharide 4-alpha-D-glucosyltransferase
MSTYKWLFALCFIFILSSSNAQNFDVENIKINEQQEAVIQTKTGIWNILRFPGDILRFRYQTEDMRHAEQISDAVMAKPLSTHPTIKDYAGGKMISWSENCFVVILPNGISVSPGISSYTNINEVFVSGKERGFSMLLQPDEMIYGGGERALPMNRRGYRLPLNNNPWYGYQLGADALNYSMPFVLSSKGYAIFFDNPSKGQIDIGVTNPNAIRFSGCSGAIDFYIIPGKSSEAILAAYHQLIGTQPLPPRWAMGNLMSRFGYRSESQARSILDQMQKDSIPVDAIIFDLFWFGDSIQHTLGNLEWMNKKAWPNPQKMIQDFHQQKVKTILITEPFIVNTSSNFEASIPYHAVDSNGNPFLIKDFYFGQGGLIDIFRKDSRDWFFGKYKQQLLKGVDGWWGDLGEPERHPSELRHQLKDLGFNRLFGADEVHNIYGHFWSKMLFEKYRSYDPNKRLFHLNRSGYAGSARYAGYPWTGDVSRSWSGLQAQLPVLLGMSISGAPYVHSDAGGFAGGDGDGELYVRWLQFAAFTPIYRPHGTALGELNKEVKDIPSEAALWPEPIRSLAKAAAIKRYQWLPYNYTLSFEQTTKGKPLMRPLFFLNDKDTNLRKANEQYLWGDQVMIVPITASRQAEKTYYIPDGVWTNLNSLDTLHGGRWYTDRSLEIRQIPIWAKAGAFIPQSPVMMRTDDYDLKPLDVIYLPSNEKSTYELFEDDGQDARSIQNKKYELIRFQASGMKKQTTITISSNGGHYPGQPSSKKMRLRIPQLQGNYDIYVNGVKVSTNLKDSGIKGISIPFTFRHTQTTITISKRP